MQKDQREREWKKKNWLIMRLRLQPSGPVIRALAARPIDQPGGIRVEFINNKAQRRRRVCKHGNTTMAREGRVRSGVGAIWLQGCLVTKNSRRVKSWVVLLTWLPSVMWVVVALNDFILLPQFRLSVNEEMNRARLTCRNNWLTVSYYFSSRVLHKFT